MSHKERKGNAKTYLKYGLHAAVLLGIVWAGMKYIDGREFANALRNFHWQYAPLVAILGMASVVVKSWRFGSLLHQTSDIERSVAMKAYVAGQSATLLPGGIAARAGLLEQVGVNVGSSGPAIALSSLTDQAGFLLCGIVAASMFESARKPVLVMLAVLAVVSALLGVEAVRTWLGKLMEKILGRFRLAEAWRKFWQGMRQTARPQVLLVGLGNTLISFVLLVLALHLCMVGVGKSVPPATLLLAFVLPTMFGRISALPGGFGVTEVGMTGVLNAAPGVSLDQAAAATLVFRLGTVVFSALVGGIVYLTTWRSTVKEEHAEATA